MTAFVYLIMFLKTLSYLWLVSMACLAIGCQEKQTQSMKVTATAYNSLAYQTSGDATITAWGDTLKPGMKAIAISRDLLDSGFYHNMEVKIDGLEGNYKVLDKMNRRWTCKIDIYMGTDVQAAREWGKREVIIQWDKE